MLPARSVDEQQNDCHVRADLRTRIGRIFIENNGLVMGRATDTGDGLVADVGLGLSFAVFSFFDLTASSWYGFHAFNGKYEGAYGTESGLDISLVLHL